MLTSEREYSIILPFLAFHDAIQKRGVTPVTSKRLANETLGDYPGERSRHLNERWSRILKSMGSTLNSLSVVPS